MKINYNDFYCLKCGQRSYSLPRPTSRQRKDGHFKKLYCPNCKIQVNHIEIKNQEQSKEFMAAFLAGSYYEAAAASELYCNKQVI